MFAQYGSAAQSADPACTPFSFELFPPRTDAAALALGRTIDRLAAVGPDFISVTYGANGSTRDRSLTVLSYILKNTDIHPLAHLTCVGTSYAEAGGLIRQFLDAGITSFLALRGDPPADAPEGEDGLGDLSTAAELVQLITRVQQEKDPFRGEPIARHPGAVRLRARDRPVRIAVAAFPNGHPRERRSNQDIDALLAKQAAGADLAITQLFFHADDYLGYVDRARAAGVSIPIIPGIMPVTTPARLRRTAELAGEELPWDLLNTLEAASDTEQQFAIGVEHARGLARAVLDGGAPALHLYTFNQHQAVLDVLAELGLAGQPTTRKEHA